MAQKTVGVGIISSWQTKHRLLTVLPMVCLMLATALFCATAQASAVFLDPVDSLPLTSINGVPPGWYSQPVSGCAWGALDDGKRYPASYVPVQDRVLCNGNGVYTLDLTMNEAQVGNHTEGNTGTRVWIHGWFWAGRATPVTLLVSLYDGTTFLDAEYAVNGGGLTFAHWINVDFPDLVLDETQYNNLHVEFTRGSTGTYSSVSALLNEVYVEAFYE